MKCLKESCSNWILCVHYKLQVNCTIYKHFKIPKIANELRRIKNILDKEAFHFQIYTDTNLAISSYHLHLLIIVKNQVTMFVTPQAPQVLLAICKLRPLQIILSTCTCLSIIGSQNY